MGGHPEPKGGLWDALSRRARLKDTNSLGGKAHHQGNSHGLAHFHSPCGSRWFNPKRELSGYWVDMPIFLATALKMATITKLQPWLLIIITITNYQWRVKSHSHIVILSLSNRRLTQPEATSSRGKHHANTARWRLVQPQSSRRHGENSLSRGNSLSSGWFSAA